MDEDGPARPNGDLALADRWILSRLDATIEDANRLMQTHQYGEAGKTIREFVWSELCDWYIEAAKVRQRGSAAERQAVAQTLAYTLERSVRLLHPFMPFVTEALWQELPHVGESVMIAAWPEAGRRAMRPPRRDFGALIEIVRAIRNARTEAGVEPGRWIAAEIFAGPHARGLRNRAARAGDAGPHRRRRARHAAAGHTGRRARRPHRGRRQRRGHVAAGGDGRSGRRAGPAAQGDRRGRGRARPGARRSSATRRSSPGRRNTSSTSSGDAWPPQRSRSSLLERRLAELDA